MSKQLYLETSKQCTGKSAWVLILQVDQNDSAEKEQNDINYSNLSLFVPSWLVFQTKLAA